MNKSQFILESTTSLACPPQYNAYEYFDNLNEVWTRYQELKATDPMRIHTYWSLQASGHYMVIHRAVPAYHRRPN